jgi:hypothetical protein
MTHDYCAWPVDDMHGVYSSDDCDPDNSSDFFLSLTLFTMAPSLIETN